MGVGRSVIIHCANDDTELVRPKVRESWSTLQACYHRTCHEGNTRAEASPTGDSHGCGESLEDDGLISSQELTCAFRFRHQIGYSCKRENSQIEYDKTACIVRISRLWVLKKSSYSQRSTPNGISKQNLAMSSSLKIF